MGLKLLIRDAINLNLESHTGTRSSVSSPEFEVASAFTDGEGNPLSGKGMRSNNWTSTKKIKAQKTEEDELCGKCSWNSEIEISIPDSISPDTCIEFAVRRDFGKLHPSHEIGRTRMSLCELVEMDEPDESGVELMLFDLGRFDNDGDVVAAGSRALPTILRVTVDRDSLPDSVAATSTEVESNKKLATSKHLMIVTRGTRGDVQPFIALSRGLAELENWDITIVTELEYKKKLKIQTKVEAGTIHFRPSGGDTMKRVSARISQKAINLKVNAKQTNVMQKIFLARSEMEFFNSEPAVYYWAEKLKPDYLMFGFTMASVTLIASEALGIPVLGFVLQPTSIPSSQYPPILPLQESTYKKMTEASVSDKHDQFKMIKYCMEHIGGDKNKNSLSSLRTRRGLEEYSSYETNTWQDLKDKNFPLIVPINEEMFGGKPDDWSENSQFTDCIFLRGDSVPPIADDAQAFIDGCRQMSGKIVVLAFSSMPVTKTAIVSIALKIIAECKSKACVFALVGGQMDLPLDKSVANEANYALRSGRLFLASGAPFGRLFPLVDTVVLHGGLGTTSEALQAKVPAIVTGVLLLDQRFWGSRCREMDVGPFGVHIDDFPDVCVEYVDKALEEDSVWRKNAVKVGSILTEQAGDDPSGVRRNVECVVRMSENAVPYYYRRSDDDPESKTSVLRLSRKLLKDALSKPKPFEEKDRFNPDEVHIQAV